jgi:TolB-like protein
MKDLIRMNQLAGTITEGQARKMIAILNEAEDFKVHDLVFIKSNGQFETKPREVHQIYGDQYVVSGHIKRGDGRRIFNRRRQSRKQRRCEACFGGPYY